MSFPELTCFAQYEVCSMIHPPNCQPNSVAFNFIKAVCTLVPYFTLFNHTRQQLCKFIPIYKSLLPKQVQLVFTFLYDAFELLDIFF